MTRTARAIVEVSEAMQDAVARIFGVASEDLDTRSLSWSRIRRRARIPGRHGRRPTSRERRRLRTTALQAERRAQRRIVDGRRKVSGDLFP